MEGASGSNSLASEAVCPNIDNVMWYDASESNGDTIHSQYVSEPLQHCATKSDKVPVCRATFDEETETKSSNAESKAIEQGHEMLTASIEETSMMPADSR